MSTQTPTYFPGLSPFKFNQNYDITKDGEALLYNSIYEEATYQFGTDIIYIERTLNTPERIYGEYLGAVISQGTPMRIFQEELTAWGGGGDMYQKFGLQVTDTVTFFCPTLTFAHSKPDPNNAGQFLPFFPKQSDLILHVNSRKLFEVTHIENEAAPGFYVFGNRNSYQIKCKMYTYDHGAVDASEPSIPAEIRALDTPTKINGTMFDLKSNEAKFNQAITTEVAVNTIVDNSEVDPLGN